MSNFVIVFMYVFMLAFDLAVLAGTAWLVVNYAWSLWWFVLAVLMCMGSAPNGIIKLAFAKAEGEKT